MSSLSPFILLYIYMVYLLLALELYVHNSELVDLLLDLVDVVADFYCTNE